VSVFAFGKRRAFITNDNSIYVFGTDFSLKILNSYTKLASLGSNIKKLAFGNDHSLILDGKIYR
jgi:hypothetical protein